MSKVKIKWKSLLCMLLCVNMLFNTLFSGWTVVAGNVSQDPKKMIYLNSVTTQAGKVFGMLAQNLEKNTQYTISFQCKVVEGNFNNAGSDDVYLRVRKEKMRSGTTMCEGHVTPGGTKGFDSYELDADGYTRRYTFTTDDTNTSYGINFEFVRAMTMYIADFKVYKTSDINKANVLPVNGNSDVLLTNVETSRTPGVGGWDADYPTALTINTAKTEVTYGASGATFYTATLQDYDKQNVFVPALQQGQKMIYIDSVTTQAGKVFGMLAQNLEKNTQYTISFQCKVVEGNFNNVGSDDVYLRVRKEKIRSGTTLCEGHVTPGETKGFDRYELDADGYTRRYTFTTDDTNTNYGINFEFVRAMKMYIADFKVYKTSDANKTNVLPVNGESNVLLTNIETSRTPGIGGWDADYPTALTINSAKTVMTYANASNTFYTARLMNYDSENVFVPLLPQGQKMIYIDSVTTQAGKVFGMLAQGLEINTQYTISFKCKVVEGNFANAGSDDVYLRVRKEKMRSGTTMCEGHVTPGEAKGFDSYELDADGYTRRYTFTTDDTNTNYGINFEFVRAMKMYIADFKVYKTSDAEKTNVLPVNGESDVLLTNVETSRTPGIGGWDADYPTALTINAAKTEMTCKNASGTFYTVQLMPYDSETIFVPQGTTTEPETPPTISLPKGPKMIKWDVTETGKNQIFGQNVLLEQGKKYTISFQYAFEEGTMNTSMYLQLKAKFGSGKYTTYRSSHETGEKAFDSFAYDKATSTATYTFTHKEETGEYGVGFASIKPVKVYLANMTLYDVLDASKKNILPSAKMEEESLEGWRSDYKEAGEVESFVLKNNSDDLMYTATLNMYDADIFKSDVEIGPKMICLDVTNEGKNQLFGQNVNLEKGKKYTISFQYKFEEGSMNATTYLQVKDALGSGKYKAYHSSHMEDDQGFVITEDEATCTAYYTFTHTQASGQYGVGFMSVKPYKLYLANVTLYESSDNAKKNLLPSNISEQYSLNGWRSDYVQAGEVQEFKLKNNKDVLLYTATLQKYDAKTFEPKKIEPTMLYIEAGEKAKDQVFGQNVKLEKGKNYTISFRYKFKEGDMNASAFLRVKDALKSGKYQTYRDSNATGNKGMDVKYDKQTCLAQYTFTHTENTGTYAVGFQFNGITKMYIADFKVYETNDKTQKNLLPSRGNEDTLLGWGADWLSAETEKTFKPKTREGAVMYTVTVMPCDNSIFKPDPELSPRMLYIENNGTYRQLVQRVKVEPGQTYRFSFCVASPIAVTGMVMHKGERVAIFNAMNPINEPDYKKDYYEAVYEFTLPTTFGGESVDTSNVFVGIQLPAGAIAYVFNPKLWNVNDKEQTNLYVNPGFNKGLDNWAVSWGAWFIPGQQGMGVTEYEKEGDFKLQVMDYDEEKFITYYDDSRMNDGEWWSADDIVDTNVGTATIKGRFLTDKGSPIKKAKMVLKSLKETFECETDKDGKFSYEKLPAGFYELYYVDDDGNMIQTTFAQNIKDGYTVNVDVFANDGANGLTWFLVADAVAVGAIVSTVLVLRKRKKKRLANNIESE